MSEEARGSSGAVPEHAGPPQATERAWPVVQVGTGNGVLSRRLGQGRPFLVAPVAVALQSLHRARNSLV